jgi:AcrR family transcriptional regulator
MSPTVVRTPRSPNPYRPYSSRLPRGPHSLTRDQVATNQRLRLVRAMLEAVGQKGYVATTVSDVVARAGVSRKAFYQHFANKQECFLATYDAIAKAGKRRVVSALREADGSSDRMEATIQTLFEAAVEHPDALRLAIIETSAVGPAGIERRDRAISELGGFINDGLRRSTQAEGLTSAAVLPETTVRAVVGGLNRVVVACLPRGRGVKPVGLVPDLARWISAYHPAPKGFTSNLRAARTRQRRALVKQQGGRAPGTLAPRQRNRRRRMQRSGHGPSRSFIVHNQRERILDAVTNLTANNGYGALTVEEIAAEASVSLQAFYEHFESKEDAFLVAYELGHAKGLDIVEEAFERAPNWRTGVRDGLAGLMSYLASEPAFARLALMGTIVATPRATELSDRGLAAYAQLLAPGLQELPKRLRPPQIALEATVGGLQELFLHYATQGRINELPELAVDATYLALTPFIGAQAAAQVAVEPLGTG